MPIFKPIQYNFTSGELSPRLSARVDFERRANGVEKLENCLVQPQGPATRRPGTRFVAEVKTSAKKTRVIPFEFSTTQAYIIEVGDQYMRFYRDGGRIEDPPGTPVEIVTPYLEADLFDLKFAQTADVVYIVHPNYHPRKLTRTSHTAWTLTEVEFVNGPYLDANATATTITPSGTTGSITLTASTGIFQSGHVGSIWQITHGATTGYVKITGFTSSTQVNADVKVTLGGNTATTEWREGAYSGVRGYPTAVTFHEQRIIYAGTKHEPQRIDGSKSNADYDNFTPGVNDDDPFTFKIASDQANPIRWLASSDRLAIGTSGAEFTMEGGNNNPITPTNVLVRRRTKHGVSKVAPVQIGGSVLFWQRSGRKLRQFDYNLETDNYKAPDLTVLAEHITEGGITDVTYQQEPESVLWAIRSDGVLLSMTYLPGENVIAWARHITDGAFESVASIPHWDGTRDVTWVVAKRTINGQTKRYVEYLDPDLFTDCAITYDGAPASVFTGIDHLEGKTVKVVGDMAAYPDTTVSGGQITIDPAASKVEVGLGFTPLIRPLEPEVKLQDGTSIGRKKRWAKVGVRVYNTRGATIEGDELPTRSSDDLMGQAPAPFTGDIVLTNTGWSRNAQLTITQPQPVPFTVQAIYGTLEIGDE